MPTMRAAATARCWRRAETLAIMESALRPADRARRSPMTRASASARSTSASSPPAMCSAPRRSCSSTSGERVVVSGDYKRRPDPTCACFVPVPCDIFITEATFGLPVFRHPDTGSEIDRLLHRLHSDPSRCVLVGAYALGKAQRIITELRDARPPRPDLFPRRDRAAEPALRELRRRARRASPPATGATKAEMAGHIVIAPPGALNDRWSRRLPDPVTAMASGWMRDPPARPPAQRRAAADHLRPRRLGRAHHDHPRARARPRCGSPTAARKRSSIGA